MFVKEVSCRKICRDGSRPIRTSGRAQRIKSRRMARGFPAMSCYWLGGTERSRPFPTNQPKVRNIPVGFSTALNVPAPRALLIYYLLSFISYLFTCVPPATVRRRRRRPRHRRAGRLRQSAPAGGAAGSSSRPAGGLPPRPASGWAPFG